MQRQVKKSWFHKAYWILYTIATVYSFIITICYWTVVHNPGKLMFIFYINFWDKNANYERLNYENVF